MKRKAEPELTVVEQRCIELLKEVEARTGWVRSQTLTALAALLISAMVCATSVLMAAGEASTALGAIASLSAKVRFVTGALWSGPARRGGAHGSLSLLFRPVSRCPAKPPATTLNTCA